MVFRPTGKYCAVELKTLNLPVSDEQALTILTEAGFEPVAVDIVQLAWNLVGAKYWRGARMHQAPEVFDCSSFTKYLYGQRGVWLPRRSIQQRNCGVAVELDDLQAGDLVFCSGYRDYFDTDPSDGVGHVGIATGEGSIIHAASHERGVVEDGVLSFLDDPDGFRGVRRIIPANANVVTLFTPSRREIETSDDLRWIVLQNLP